jgi:hypothetical protein
MNECTDSPFVVLLKFAKGATENEAAMGVTHTVRTCVDQY